MITLEKLKIASIKSLVQLNIPNEYKDYLNQYPSLPLSKDHEVVLTFTTDNKSFFKTLETLVKQDPVINNGSLWVCYPKRGNKLYPSTVHRDEIFPKVDMDEEGFVFKTVYKFNRMLGLDDTFTLLELKKLENYKPTNTISHRGADFLKYIPEVEELLKADPEAYKAYQDLTPGYRKDWAVHIFSAQTEATKQKRILETIDLVKKGHKNMTTYRQSLKK